MAGSVGLVGGLGPESTIDYYRRILDAWNTLYPGSMPSIVIDSLDVQTALRLVANDREAFIAYLQESINRLARTGVSFVAMTANTAHVVFDELEAVAPVPLLSIVEVCAEHAQQRGLRRLLLLGTRFTTEGTFYRTVCARYGVEVLAPEASDRAWIHERYIGELLKGDFRDTTRTAFEQLVERQRDQSNLDGVILGGTELPLLLGAPVVAGLPALDTTALHVDAIVRQLQASDNPKP